MTRQQKTLLITALVFAAPLLLAILLFIKPDLVQLGTKNNGTLITPDMARTLKAIGLSYVGISLDGMEEINDRFRGVRGAFDKAMAGIANCQAAGIKVGLRFTVNRFNVEEIPKVFDLLEEMEIPRVCFYHLVYAGRGARIQTDDLSRPDAVAACAKLARDREGALSP